MYMYFKKYFYFYKRSKWESLHWRYWEGFDKILQETASINDKNLLFDRRWSVIAGDYPFDLSLLRSPPYFRVQCFYV